MDERDGGPDSGSLAQGCPSSTKGRSLLIGVTKQIASAEPQPNRRRGTKHRSRIWCSRSSTKTVSLEVFFGLGKQLLNRALTQLGIQPASREEVLARLLCAAVHALPMT
jgi:hypothetical protein